MKKIIDVCCGGKMFWFDKHNPNVTFCDIRDYETTLCDGRYFEVKPDVVCDFTALPFPDNSYKLVVFDPPHLLRNTGKSKYKELYGTLADEPTGWQQKKYGALYANWQEMIQKGFAECFRVLEPGGFLIFKWNETDIKVSEVLALTNEKPLFGHKSGKRQNTHWICFMSKEEK
jgi:ubiquinone/menaquinone biosynthesis C-methylase UbiE